MLRGQAGTGSPSRKAPSGQPRAGLSPRRAIPAGPQRFLASPSPRRKKPTRLAFASCSQRLERRAGATGCPDPATRVEPLHK